MILNILKKKPFEFWILDRKTKELIAKIKTADKSVKYEGCLYTIENYEDKYIYREKNKKIYLFIEGNAIPLALEEVKVDGYTLSSVIETLAFGIAKAKLEQYIKIAVALSLITLIISVAIGYYLYVKFPADLEKIVYTAISKTFVKPT